MNNGSSRFIAVISFGIVERLLSFPSSPYYWPTWVWLFCIPLVVAENGALAVGIGAAATGGIVVNR